MDKKYFWIKLKQSLMTSDKVDYLMSQKDGANYVVLYQCLCLLCANTNGVLGKEIGEIIIPYDVAKIQRETKWFTQDTILVALELYKRLGLIYELDNGLLQIKDFNELIGSCADNPNANRVRRFREKQSVTPSITQSVTKCNVDIDKDIDIDNRYIDKDKELVNIKENKKEKPLDINFINSHLNNDDDENEEVVEESSRVGYRTIMNFVIQYNIMEINVFSEMDYIDKNDIKDWKTYLLEKYKRK